MSLALVVTLVYGITAIYYGITKGTMMDLLLFTAAVGLALVLIFCLKLFIFAFVCVFGMFMLLYIIAAAHDAWKAIRRRK